MSEVKVGDLIGLRVLSIDQDGHPSVNINRFGRTAIIDLLFVHHIPHPITNAESVLVNAAMEYIDAPSGSMSKYDAHSKIIKAAIVVSFERAPYDPLAEIKAIVMNDFFDRKELQNAITRLEEKLKESK